MRLFYRKSDTIRVKAYTFDALRVEGYTDADWVRSTMERSTSRYCTFIDGNPVTWRSKKQPMVACSTTKIESRYMANGIFELLWIQGTILDLGLHIRAPIDYDNKEAISIAHDPVQHDCTKHIEVDCHFIMKKLQSGLICTPYVRTGDQLVNVFTKGLSSPQFCSILSKLGMHDIYMPSWGRVLDNMGKFLVEGCFWNKGCVFVRVYMDMYA